VIDIHCHILPGLDDGPSNADFSMAMARRAVDTGTQMIVATPHIRSDYDISPDDIEEGVTELNDRLAEEEVPLRVLAGGEVSMSHLRDLDDATLERLRLGSGPYVMLESPYRRGFPVEEAVADVERRGFRVVLAHPERSPIFRDEPDRLSRLVDRGVLVSITAASLAGTFGDTVRRFANRLIADRLVHDVASDAHDHLHRHPVLQEGFERADKEVPGVLDQMTWFTVTAPVAILAGNPIPEPPRLETAPEPRWRRIFGRARA
jgi:protein-tyrosine phosphatase